MRTVPTCLAALAAAALLAVPARATGCPLITDDTHDGLVDVAAYDLVSADVASDAATLTTVIRVRDITPDSGVLDGGTYLFAIRIGNALIQMWASNTANGVTGHARATESPAAGDAEVVLPATVTIDPVTEEIRVSTAVSGLPSYAAVPSGTVLSGLHASVFAEHDVLLPVPPPGVSDVFPGAGLLWDDAWASDTYTAGTAGCITP